MNTTHKLLAASVVACSSYIGASAASLSVQDYCDVNISAPASVKEMTPLADGEQYAAISDDGKSIETFSYKTGKKTGVLFDINTVKGEIKIKDFDGFNISDNGRKILLWNNKEKIYRHSFRAEYYVFDTMRQTLARVSTGGAQRGAVLSHDGRMVAYVRGNNIFISNLDYQTDKAITTDGKENVIINGVPDWGYEEEFGIENTIRWSSDDNTLAYVKFNEEKVPAYSFDDYKSFCSSDPLSDPYPESYTYKYTLPGYPNSIVSVHAYDLNTMATKKMDIPMSDTDYIPSMEFDGNGTSLMVMTLNRDQNSLHLYAVNPGSTVARQVLTESSKTWLSNYSFQMVKYYKDFFVIASDRSGYRHLYQYGYSGNLIKQLTSGDFNVTKYYGYDPAGKRHYMQTTSLGAINRSVAYIDAQGKLKLIFGESGTEKAWFSRNFRYFLRYFSTAQIPPVYTICTNEGKKVVDVENNASYAAKYAAAPKMEFLKVPNAVGEEMDAFIIKPTGFDPSKKYPVLTYQYNGPESQLVLNDWKIDGIFYLASKGFVIGCVDGRGTGNRSRAWADAVYKQLGVYEAADQVAGAKYFAALPYTDAEKVACFGWSYGGYMTLMELTEDGNPFKAGISMAPVTDWKYYDSIYTERYMLTPQQNPEGYRASSALERSLKMNRKLLIMSGTSDDNVHIYNTLKYTSKLGFEGTLCDMMVFTGFEHSLRMCNAREMLFRRVEEFLNNNLLK